MANQLFKRWDLLLISAFIFPLLTYCFWNKWWVVDAATPLENWALVDFVRLHLGYYGLMLLWSCLMLLATNRQWLARALTLLLMLFFAAADLGYSATIFFTGALAPYDVAYYMGKATGKIPFSIQTTEWLTLALVPAVFLATVLIRRRAWSRYWPKRIVSISGSTLLLMCAIPPIADSLELNVARPSYAYQLMEFFERKFAFSSVQAAEGVRPDFSLISKDKQKPASNLVIIALESVGANATGIYNPARQAVTPFLSALAASSWVAERAYTVVPHTSKAMVAINCGQQPYLRHPIFESLYGSPTPCLASLLREQGYATAFFQSPTERFENRRGLVKQMGFETFVSGDELNNAGFQLANYFGYEDNILLEPSRVWLEQQQTPFFAFYLTGTTHHPYWMPDTYGIQTFDEFNPEKNRYLNAVHYLDNFVSKIIDQYKQAGKYENTIFVIVGDHGESFDKARKQHNASLYQDVVQIPLIVHAPTLIKNPYRSPLASQVDILPSVLDLMGYRWRGEPEGVALINTAIQRETAMTSCWYDLWCASLVDYQYKYIFNFEQKKEELYDLHADPNEEYNIAELYPDITAVRREHIRERTHHNLQRWEAHLASKNVNFRYSKDETLGAPVKLLRLSPSDPRHEHYQKGEH